jgi:glycine/D-amino acid oxidase-like deaminating enzyme
VLLIVFFYFVKSQFVQFGGVLQDNEEVTDIVPGDIVHVKTTKALYRTRKLILTPGTEEMNE